MRYDRQSDCYVIPAVNVASATRDGKPVNLKSAFEVHQDGEITLIIKKESPDGHQKQGSIGQSKKQ